MDSRIFRGLEVIKAMRRSDVSLTAVTPTKKMTPRPRDWPGDPGLAKEKKPAQQVIRMQAGDTSLE